MSRLKQLSSVALLCTIFTSSIVYADQTHQTEVIGGFKRSEDGSFFTSKLILLGAAYYFSPVVTGKMPIAEAGFVSKESLVVVGYVRNETDYDDYVLDSYNVDGYAAGIEYITDVDSFILNLNFSNTDGSTTPDRINADGERFELSIGKYINDTSALKISYSNSRIKTEDILLSKIRKTETNAYGFSYKTLKTLGDQEYLSFVVDYDLMQSDSTINGDEDNSEIGISGSYYFSRNTSLGLGLEFNIGDDVSDEGETIAVGFTHYAGEKFGINFEVSKFIADDVDTQDEESVSIDFIVRI